MNLGTIQQVYGHAGPFVTVHLDVSRNTEHGAQQVEARWNNARQELESAGVDGKLVEQIGERVQAVTDIAGEARRTVVAADGDIVFEDVLAGSTVWPETTAVGPLPDLSGWVSQVDGQIPFVLVVADREGADIDFYRAMARPDAEHSEVHGDTFPIQKVQVGGWAHKRFQQRAENTWVQNAREVADAVREIYHHQRPRVVILAGEERSRTEIANALENLQAEVEQVRGGGRAAGASDEALWEDVSRVLAQIEAAQQQDLTARLEQAHGQGGAAALGLDAVLDAFVQGKVEHLLVDLQKARNLTVNPSRFPGLVLPAAALEERELPADQVLLAAGAATDAAITVLPEEQVKGGGIAAILRWTD